MNQIQAALLVGTVLAAGCGKLRDAEVPHRIHVPEWAVVLEDGEGSASARVEEVWVYTPTDVLGAFPLPADIPVLAGETGEVVELTFSAGIRANGIAATRKPYPPYAAVPVELALTEGGFDTLSFEAGYADGFEVLFVEDFETANRFAESVTSTAEVVRTTADGQVFEGVGSGRAELSASAATVWAQTNEQQYPLNPNGPCWLEFDYACTQSFAIGLNPQNLIQDNPTPILVLNSSDGAWKKIYLDLGPVVRSETSAAWFEVTLEAVWDGSAETTWFAVDNLKIVQAE